MTKVFTFFVLFLSINRLLADSASIGKVNTHEWPQKHPLAIEEAVALNQVSTFRYLRWEQSTEPSFEFVVRWSVRNVKPLEKISLQLEYLQMGRFEPQKLELNFPNLKSGSRWSRFTLKGDEYVKNGDVIAWKISVLGNGTVLATKQSILWRNCIHQEISSKP